MPVYQYYCKSCTVRFDMVLHIEDRNTPVGRECPFCGVEESIDRLLDAPGMIYIREGAMRTDNDFNNRMEEIKKPLDNAHIPNTVQTR